MAVITDTIGITVLEAFTAWFFIEIGRQAGHHDRGETHFWELENVGCYA